MLLEDVILVALLGITHGFDPDHIATAKLLNKFKKIFIFALSHSLGFVILAIPLSLLITILHLDPKILELPSNMVGLLVGTLLLLSVILEKEFEIEPKTMGILQGALIVTPSKILTVILAISSGVFLDAVIIVSVFVLSSTLSILALSLLNFIPKKYSKIANISISTATIIFFSLTIVESI